MTTRQSAARSKLSRLAVIVVAVVAPAVVLSNPAYAALWYEHYTAAEKALARGDHAQAIEELTSALEKKGDSSARARTYGMKFMAYFPYLKLGIAYLELGRHDAALQAFETEERLGAIAESEGHRDELERFRERALEARAAAEAREAARIGDVVRDSLAGADTLEAQGDIEGAIAALAPALALAPDDETAVGRLERLRAELASRREQRDRQRRLDILVARGRELLAEGLHAEASSMLRQALALGEDFEARSLLEDAQRELREEAKVDERSRSTTQALAEATELRGAGRIAEALERLQPALALDPENQGARTLERALIEEQSRAENERLVAEAVAGDLEQAERAIAAGRFEEALAFANRVLAVAAGNETALGQLARAYRAINSRLLGASPRQNFPPAIRFADLRHELADGSRAEQVRRPGFRLTGVVLDDSAVSVEFFDAENRPLSANSSTQPLGDLFITEFRLTHRLEPGATTVRLVATDADNLTSSAEYSVVYSRPVFRSPWFYGALVAVAIAGAGIVESLRRQRLRTLRRRKFNPYMAGAPVLDEKLFFGRERLLDRILQTLHNNSLLLHGERRIGKTTLQHQLKRRLETLDDPLYEFFPVYIDLQGTREEHFFATLAAEIFEGLRGVLDGLEPRKAASGVYSYRDLVADLRAVLKTLRQRSGKRVRLVLLIDEVDELNAYDPRVNQKLRSLFMKSFAEDLVAVVSGVSIKREWDREGSPWYNFFEEIDVGPFEPRDARDLVEKPIDGVLEVEDDAVDRIVELTGGRPYRIQRLCMKLVSRAYEHRQHDITVADVDAIGDPDSRGAS